MTLLHKFKTGGVLAAMTLGLAAVSAAAHAEYPERPIQLIVGYPPGGSADVVARPLSVLLSKKLGVPIVVENRPGAGSSIGTQAVARANPDGYTVGLVLAAHAINPSLYKNLPYNTEKDFAPVGKIADLPMALYVNSQFPAKTVGELIAYAKANPGKVTLASSGNGNTTHLAIELFATSAGIDLLHVPYKGGGPAQTAALGGEVSGLFDGPHSLNMVQSGRVRVLGFASKDRLSLAPEVPTISEAGLPGFQVSGWYGLVAPAGTPQPVIDKLNSALNEVLKGADFPKTVEPLGYIVTPSTPAEFGTFVTDETARWKKVIQDANIKLD